MILIRAQETSTEYSCDEQTFEMKGLLQVATSRWNLPRVHERSTVTLRRVFASCILGTPCDALFTAFSAVGLALESVRVGVMTGIARPSIDLVLDYTKAGFRRTSCLSWIAS